MTPSCNVAEKMKKLAAKTKSPLVSLRQRAEEDCV